MAERHGVVDDAELRAHALGRRQPVGLGALELERHHAGEVLHLAPRQLVLRVALEARVVDPRHAGVGVEPARDRQRSLLMRLHPERQGGRAARDQPGVEGAHHPAVMHDRLAHQRPDQPGPAADEAADRVAMAADILGRRVHDIVRPQLQRAGADGAREGAVDREPGAARMGDLRRCRDVGEAEERVAGGVDEDELRLLPHRRLQRAEIRGVDLAHRDPHPGQRVAG